MDFSDQTELVPTQDALFLMSNLYPEDTGLPFTVWIHSQGEDQLQHGARVKVSEGRRPIFIASVSVDLPAQVVAGQLSDEQMRLVSEWIDLNRDAILKHWRNEMSSAQVANLLKPIG